MTTRSLVLRDSWPYCLSFLQCCAADGFEGNRLKALAEELQWKDKTIMFARLGNLGCLSSYVRLKTGK